MKIVKPVIAIATLVDHRVDEDIWGGRIALQYQLPSQAMVYGLISRGYKAGGVNSNPSVAAEDREFDTELMLNYELGAKGRWLDDALAGTDSRVLSAAR